MIKSTLLRVKKYPLGTEIVKKVRYDVSTFGHATEEK